MARIIILAIIFILLLSLLVALPLFFSLMKPAAKSGPLKTENLTKTDPPANPKVDLPDPIPSIESEPSYDLNTMELNIHTIVNEQRIAYGLPPLKYNQDLANVAREHSISLARENIPLTDPSIYCPEIFIHHEGTEFGLYEVDRLYNRSIYYFDAAGENIFMTSTWTYQLAGEHYKPCEGDLEIISEYESLELMKEDYQEHLEYSKSAARVNWTSVEWADQPELEKSIVEGWMESPGHKANILEPTYTEGGMGVAKINNFIIVTQIFIDRAECGYKDAECCIEGLYEYCYEPWQCYGTCE
jgi:uncharacterized protein YkwD